MKKGESDLTTSLLKKIGQLFIIGFNGKTVSSEIKQMIHTYHIGGVILFNRNIGSPEETLALTSELQREARRAKYEFPLLIGVDQENGVVRRLGAGATILPGAMTLGATHYPHHAYTIGEITGKELQALGINWNLAPVLDINTNPKNPVIGVRSFGECPGKVARFGKAMMTGMRDVGMITTLKHFPGHGDTHVDSHVNLPIITHDVERLHRVELKPFQVCIEEGADVVMTAHVYFPHLEPERNVPATLSRSVITDVLRNKLGYQGVVTTDCLEMDAIAQGMGTEEGALQAIKAGADLVMISHTVNKQIRSIYKIYHAVINGQLSEEEIQHAILRINALKEKYLHWKTVDRKAEHDPLKLIGCEQHRRMALDVYQNGVTIVENEPLFPIQINRGQRIIVIEPKHHPTLFVEGQHTSHVTLGRLVRNYAKSAELYSHSTVPTDSEMIRITSQIRQSDLVILGVHTKSSSRFYQRLIMQLEEIGASVVIMAMKSPYDVANLRASAYVYTYEHTKPALATAVDAIFGKIRVQGKLPIQC